MILSGQTLRNMKVIHPFHERTQVMYYDDSLTLSYGLGPAGYDVRIAEEVTLLPGTTQLASTYEHFSMPNFCMAIVHDKSTWARKGLAVQNTVIEPGWYGYLTLELTYMPVGPISLSAPLLNIPKLAPIAQIVFHTLDVPTEQPYSGKYQDQPPGPQQAR
jgi:dCTP deaminase